MFNSDDPDAEQRDSVNWFNREVRQSERSCDDVSEPGPSVENLSSRTAKRQKKTNDNDTSSSSDNFASSDSDDDSSSSSEDDSSDDEVEVHQRDDNIGAGTVVSPCSAPESSNNRSDTIDSCDRRDEDSRVSESQEEGGKTQSRAEESFPAAPFGQTMTSSPSSDGAGVCRLIQKSSRNKRRSLKKKRDNSNKKREKHDNGGLPINRTSWRRVEGAASLVSGSRNTCQPDTVFMVLNDMGISGETRDSVRNKLMPDWRKSGAAAPTIGAVSDFYASKVLSMSPRRDLNSNPLALLRQKDGVFHLSTSITMIVDDVSETTKHACLYNASQCFPNKTGRGVLRDNQADAKALLIEDSDRIDKKTALNAFHQLWSDCSKIHIVAVHEVKK